MGASQVRDVAVGKRIIRSPNGLSPIDASNLFLLGQYSQHRHTLAQKSRRSPVSPAYKQGLIDSSMEDFCVAFANVCPDYNIRMFRVMQNGNPSKELQYVCSLGWENIVSSLAVPERKIEALSGFQITPAAMDREAIICLSKGVKFVYDLRENPHLRRHAEDLHFMGFDPAEGRYLTNFVSAVPFAGNVIALFGSDSMGATLSLPHEKDAIARLGGQLSMLVEDLVPAELMFSKSAKAEFSLYFLVKGAYELAIKNGWVEAEETQCHRGTPMHIGQSVARAHISFPPEAFKELQGVLAYLIKYASYSLPSLDFSHGTVESGGRVFDVLYLRHPDIPREFEKITIRPGVPPLNPWILKLDHVMNRFGGAYFSEMDEGRRWRYALVFSRDAENAHFNEKYVLQPAPFPAAPAASPLPK